MYSIVTRCIVLSLTVLAGCTGRESVIQEDLNPPAVQQQEEKDLMDLQGKVWKLESVKSTAADNGFTRKKLDAADMGDFYTLQFDDQRISGKAAPNQYSAAYHQDGKQGIGFSAMVSTRMMSFKEPEDLKEHEYYLYLSRVRRWDLVQDKLELYTADEEGLEVILIFGTQ
ncbi:MAG: META domain-containing protein [Treponema sp.]|nr:META domain-containing protein [Treponema sp.]